MLATQPDKQPGGRSFEWTGKRFSSFVIPPGHHPDGPADAGDERPGAMVAIRKEFPDAKIILATYKGNVRRHEAGARGYLLKTQLDKELVGTTRAAYSGN